MLILGLAEREHRSRSEILVQPHVIHEELPARDGVQ